MKQFNFWIIICCFAIVQTEIKAQLLELGPCAAVEINPVFKILYVGKMPKPDGISPNQYLPCGSETTEDNSTWYVFRPSKDKISFSIPTSNCIEGTCSVVGIEATIWEQGESCADLRPIACAVGLSLEISADVQPAKPYFLQIDGICETQCYTTVNFDANEILTKMPPTSIIGDRRLCKGLTVKYCATNKYESDDYKWVLSPVGVGTIKKISNTCVEVTFKTIPSNGKAQLSAEPIFIGKIPPFSPPKIIDLLVGGEGACHCEGANAGEMQLQNIIIASKTKDSIMVKHKNGTQTLRSKDTYAYVLHEGSGDEIINQKSINKTGVFTYDAAKMQCNRIYYVSYVVGNNVNNLPSLTDLCLSIVPKGQAVSWFCKNTVSPTSAKKNEDEEQIDNQLFIEKY